MPFHEIDEAPELRLPVSGKTYVVASPDAKTGLWVTSMMQATGAVLAGVVPEEDARLELDDDEERDLYRRILGPTYDELMDDKVPWHTFKRIGTTAFVWVAFGDDAAERAWNRGRDDDPKAQTPEAPASSASEAPPA